MVFQGKYLNNNLLLVISFTIALPLKLIFFPVNSVAQVIPDNTLGVESSTVIPINSSLQNNINSKNIQQFLIEGGAARNSNLFHSFREFNINKGQQVSFTNPEGITNILTRVTGNNASNIAGFLRVNGDANLFLINPNGIVFTEGANINLNGSFLSSTADSINFADGSNFSAVNPALPPLLTVNIPVGLQLGNNSQSINARQAIINASKVTLIGGDINLKETKIRTPGGEIKLGSLAQKGTIAFNNFPLNVKRGDINISDRSLLDVISRNGGNILLYGNTININNSNLQGGIGVGLGATDVKAGDIYLDATSDILLDNSNINNNLEKNSLGNGGTIEINAANLILQNSRISSETRSQGNAGNVIVNTNKLKVISNPKNSNTDNPNNPNLRKGLFSIVTPDGIGNGGNIIIKASEISLSGLGGIDSSTIGIGNAGKIDIQSDHLIIKNGAGVFANGRGIGNGGEIRISATEFISISDNRVTNRTREGKALPGGIIADVGFDALSNGGNITLETGKLTITDGAFITTDTKGFGNGGNIDITATDFIKVIGTNSSNNPSQIVAAVRTNTEGDGGNVTITTQDLTVGDGAKINVSTNSKGDAGSLSITADRTVNLQGIAPNGITSTITAQVGIDATGKGGNISLSAKNLTIADGGQISASTLGIGEGGRVTVTSDRLAITGFTSVVNTIRRRENNNFVKDTSQTIYPSGIFASSPGKGDANALSIKTNSLFIAEKGQLSVSSQQQGEAGNLSVEAEIIKLDNGILSAETIEGEQANIFLTAPNIQLRNNSSITTNASRNATGGNININAETLVAIENSDITANAEDNFGGRVSIDAVGVFGTKLRDSATPQSDITATSLRGAKFSGVVEINTPDADPTAGIVKLPENLLDASQQITTSCDVDRNNSFVVTGKGGLPPSPQEFLQSQTVLQDWRLSLDSENDDFLTADRNLFVKNRSNIVEAQNWVVNSNGKVELIAAKQTDSNIWLQNLKCDSFDI